MSDKNYGSVVIVDNKEKVIGICTERDILKKLHHINTEELFMFVDLVENRSF